MPTTRTTTAMFKEALEQLASIDLLELCNEAKIERCRATRDLSSCGRYVQHVLVSCGHASLCAECSQRCDVCPICRTSIPKDGSRLRLRLYYKCIEAGLISKRCDERFQDKDDSGGHIMAEIQRLYCLFDVALENNLVSLICHYVTDVCMDENAVSSDPVVAFLFDEVVVKDWCKQTFNNIIYDLQEKYCLGAEGMKSNLCSLQKLVVQLTGIANVLEVMVSSIKEAFSGPLHDLHYLLENILKAKQHLEIMLWCIRHQFLENVQSRFPSYTSWNFHFHERKSAAVKRAWPDIASYSEESLGSKPTLFIEEALSNLGLGQDDDEEREESVISCLQDRSSPSLQSDKDEINKSEGMAYYPFKSVRTAADVLFLHGTSDMVVAKHAIFLYFLFDRHWSRPDPEWRFLVDDFAASFGISRHSVLESLTYYLLDDHTDQALQEATHLLSEIACPETHPKIAQVLLERQRPDVALTVLRCTGRDGFSVYAGSEHNNFSCVSLNEAVTAIRVRIECGHLTESFMYQRMHCSKIKELASRKGSVVFSSISKSGSWVYQVEVLVTEICQLCIRMNIVDRMIELPWNSDEEKFIYKCLFGHTCQNPASICGSLLVVFYLQRYRYVEAYQLDCKLQSLEQSFSETANEDVLCRINSISHWRSGLVEKSLELLPEVQRRQAMAECAVDSNHTFSEDAQMPTEPDPNVPNPVSMLSPSSAKTPFVLQRSLGSFSSRRSPADARVDFTASISNAKSETGKKTPSVLQHRLLSSLVSPAPRMNSLVGGISVSSHYNGNLSASDDVTSNDEGQLDRSRQYGSVGSSFPTREAKRSVSKTPQNGHHFHAENSVRLARITEQSDGFYRITAESHVDLMDVSQGNGLRKESSQTRQPKNSKSGIFLGEVSPNLQSSMKRDSPAEDSNTRVGSRWRSDESSEDEAEHGVDRQMGGTTPIAGRRRARFSRR